MLWTALLALASAENCDDVGKANGGTERETPESKAIEAFNCSDPGACCRRCGETPACSAWTLDVDERGPGLGVCRTKAGAWKLDGTGSSFSGFTAPTPSPSTPAPATLLPTPPFAPLPPGARNVLMIIVDDLRPEIEAYGLKTAITPNINKLASEGLLFTRAYVQYSFCAPSRNSFMTGRRPDRTRAWNFVDSFREPSVGVGWSSMPQYFKEHGVLTLGCGKLFHPNLPPQADAPYSWSFGDASDPTNLSIPYVAPGDAMPADLPRVIEPTAINGCQNNSGEAVLGDLEHWCAYNMTRLNELYPSMNGKPLWDQQIAAQAVSNLEAAAGTGRPFFIGVGFHRPHLPFASPVEYHEALPDASAMPPPKHNQVPHGSPLAAWHNGGFGEPTSTYTRSVPDVQAQVYRKAYYAAVGYTDTNVGTVLDALARLGLTATTAVVFMGDHGWQLGEMNEWRKMTNWELGVRVPLIFRVPWKPASSGVKCSALVEAVDLFPTLAALAGLPDPRAGDGYPVQNLQGDDLSPYFDAPPLNGTGSIKSHVFSQFAKEDTPGHDNGWLPCTKCSRAQWDYFGYSVRGDRWRYTEWVAWNKTTEAPMWGVYGHAGGQELYDHQNDFGADMDVASERINLAHDLAYAAEVAELSKVLRAHFQNDA